MSLLLLVDEKKRSPIKNVSHVDTSPSYLLLDLESI